MEEHDYLPELTFNFDETMLHPGKNRLKVIVCSEAKVPLARLLPKGQHMSLGLCISAVGGKPQPLLIFPLVNLPPLSDTVTSFFHITGQENGWMTVEIFHLWVIHIFIPYVNGICTRYNDSTLQALLIVDGHSSRENDITIGLLKGANIDVLVLPAHSSATTQPLDLTVNGVFKNELSKSFKVISGEKMEDQCSRLLIAAVLALESAMATKHCMTGFSRAGIFPFNPEALWNSELVADPATLIQSMNPTRKTKRARISNTILTNRTQVPTVYLSYDPPAIPQIATEPATHDYLVTFQDL